MAKVEQVETIRYNAELRGKGFSAYQVDRTASGHNYSRKEFYKISLTSGKFLFHYAEKTYQTEGPILFFGNPLIPYSCEIIEPTVNGFSCLFTEDFLQLGERSESLLQSPFFKIGGMPILALNNQQKEDIEVIYRKMIADQDSDYPYKAELLRSYIGLIIHESLKIQPLPAPTHHHNASERITAVFLELLERQFPIESVSKPLTLKTAQDYAQVLAVHTNYLNSALKAVTGKPTSTHIAERIINEAKALLQHTDWTIADIGYALGFEYPTYFNNFFKKRTGHIPKALRGANL